MLAQSQFFFLRNMSITTAANSCGTSRVCLDGLSKNAAKLANRKISGAFRMPSIKAAKPTLLSNRKPVIGNPLQKSRSFSTFSRGLMQDIKVSPEMKHAAQTFSEAHKAGRSAPGGGAKRPRPLNSSKAVGYWLIGCAGFASAIVILGGLTRLTESGLSITEWKPVTGSIPPLNEQDWEKEFELYRNSPEFKILNANMTLSEFKFIYYMEWTHRLWGRLLGLCFAVPAAYFIYARKTSAHTTGKLVVISGLIGLQGLIGWWMVKSGLNQDFMNTPGSHPRVSQYRLATHLAAAFVLYIAMFGTGLQILRESRWVKAPANAMKEFAQLSNPAVGPFRRYVLGLRGLVFLTAMTGAFVAGLDAGMIYNSFPYMGETIVPPSSELLNSSYASNASSKFNVFWKNCFENPTTVQFIHRCMAVTTYFAVFGMHVYSLRRRHVLPKAVVRAGGYCFLFVNMQAALGWATLVYVVPTPLASMHQAGSMVLMTSILFLASRLALPRTSIKYLISALAQKGAKVGSKVK